MKHIRLLLFVPILSLALSCAFQICGQATSVVTTGLMGPSKITIAGQTHLLVAETGTAMPNCSRISLVNRETGERQTLINNLPSGFNQVEMAPSGISGLKLSGLKLYVTIGQGDSAIPGPQGGVIANPLPATPFNNSVLELTLPADYEYLTSDFTLSRRFQRTLTEGATAVLHNTDGQTLGVRVVANLPDFRPETRPGLPPDNVRPANLYGIERAGANLYVVDASFNQLYRVNPVTGEFATFTVFPPRPNPLPFGPPVVEAVPDSIRLFGNRLLVTHLSGFPFPQDFTEARAVNLATGMHQTFISGLTSAIDILPVPVAGGASSFYVLEFSANMLAQPTTAPGRLKIFVPGSAGLTSTTLVSDLISPTSMARDPETGDLFITEIFTGRIIRYDVPEGN